VTKEEVLNFLNEDEGCKKQFEFYQKDITKTDYIEMLLQLVKMKIMKQKVLFFRECIMGLKEYIAT